MRWLLHVGGSGEVAAADRQRAPCGEPRLEIFRHSNDVQHAAQELRGRRGPLGVLLQRRELFHQPAQLATGGAWEPSARLSAGVEMVEASFDGLDRLLRPVRDLFEVAASQHKLTDLLLRISRHRARQPWRRQQLRDLPMELAKQGASWRLTRGQLTRIHGSPA